MSMKVKSSVLSIPIYIETTKVEGLSHLTKYPYVRENDVYASGVVKKQPFSNLCKSYRNDDRFENHWFYYRGTPRGYMITLDIPFVNYYYIVIIHYFLLIYGGV